MNQDQPLTRADDLRPLIGAVGRVLEHIAWLFEQRVVNEDDPAWTDDDKQAISSFAQANTAAVQYLGSKIGQLQQAEEATEQVLRSLTDSPRKN